MNSATLDGAPVLATLAQHFCFPYLFPLVWFSRSRAAHTIVDPDDGARRVTASATQDAGFTIVTFFVCPRAPENV